MRAGRREANIIPGDLLARPPKSKQKRGSLQKSTKRNFPQGMIKGRCSSPGKHGGASREEWAWRLFYFPAVWELFRGSLSTARGYSPLYRMRRPTARMDEDSFGRPSQCDPRNVTEKQNLQRLGLGMMGGVGSRSLLQQGSLFS